MPSISALNEFRNSFSNIANERSDLASKSLSYDTLALPETEAPPFVPSRPSSSDDIFDIGESAAGDTAPPSDDFDFGAFLGSLSPDNESPPSVDDIFSNESPPSDSSGESFPDADFSGDDLLNDMSPPADAGLPAADDPFPMADSGNDSDDAGFDLGGESLDDFPLPETPGDLPASDDIFTSDNSIFSNDTPLPDFEDKSADSDTDDEIEEGFDLGGESLYASSEGDFGSEAELGSSDNLDFDNLSDTDFTGMTESSDFDSSLEGTDFAEMNGFSGGDFPENDSTFKTDEVDFSTGESLDSENVSSGGTSFEDLLTNDDSAGRLAGLESFGDDLLNGLTGSGNESEPQTETESSVEAFGDDFLSDSIDLESEIESESHTETESMSEAFGDNDFSLDGIDDMFAEKAKIDAAANLVPKTSLFKRKKKKEDVPKVESIEEIKLTNEELDSLLGTLSNYPLNLRIACQELIAEQVLIPAQLSKVIRDLIDGVSAKEMAVFAGQILGRTIIIPKSFEKSSGEALEAEKSSFAYIFIHRFLPVLRIFSLVAVMLGCITYLGYQFIYKPIKAESIYKRGYELIFTGEYQRANQLFAEAYGIYRKKRWFYLYAEAFRDERRYLLAEEKYEQLLRLYPRDKKGVLDYADLQTHYLMNFEKANRILQEQLLDYSPDDFEGLLAAGDNFFAWADSDPLRYGDKYEDARFSWARLLERYGWEPPIVERMMKYFIRVDDLREVLYLRHWFENHRRAQLSAPALAELGGYLLDKQLEEQTGVPNPYIESIESVRDMLLQAVREDVNLPEPHYHLARYHHWLGNTRDERLTLENAIRAFDLARSESVRRRLFRIDSHYRYANLLIENKEFFPAEENVIRGIELFNDFMGRNLIFSSPQLGKLYAVKGDLEFFVKTGNMQAALVDYHRAEQHGWSPPEMKYRMGAAYYQLEEWGNAFLYISGASSEMPLNRRILFALGNTAYQRGNYFAAQGFYSRLIDILENQRVRLPVLLPNDRPEFLELGERLMMARNNAGVVYEALADQTGDSEYRARALANYAESARAWDPITRDPRTMERMRLAESPGVPGINLGFLNAANAMRAAAEYSPQIFIRIDKDALEPSRWEELAPFGGMIH